MSTARKTIAIADLLLTANHTLAYVNSLDTTDSPDLRHGICALLESALFATGNYRGYGFLASEWDEDGESPKLRDGYDTTRRVYFG